MKVFEAVAEALVAEGVEVVFGLLGGGNDGLIWELQQRGVRFVPSRHEQGAVGMADGYAQATGKIGLASISHGPGLSNAATPMINARCSNSPVLVYTSDTAPRNRHNNMNFDQPPFIAATAGARQELARAELVTESVELCFRHLRGGNGPIVLNVPDDVVEMDVADDWRYLPSGLSRVPVGRSIPEPSVISSIAELVRESSRPVILAGRGAVWADARQVLGALAEQIGAIVSSTLLAKSFFRGDPFDVGVSGGFAFAGTARILRDADLVLAFGASLSHETTGHGGLYSGAKLVQVSTDRMMANDQTVADLIAVGDARLTAEALLEELRGEQRSGWRDDETRARVEAIDRFEEIDLAPDTDGYLNLYLAYKTMDELLPKERLLLVDGGYFMGGPPVYLQVLDPRDQVLPWRFGAIGGATGPTFGAAVGRPDRTAVLVTGDGGLMMNLQELDTAVRCDIPVIIFVVDNGGFAMERPRYRPRGWNPDMADYENPDFGRVASALGYDGYTPTSNEDLERILNEIGVPSRPTFISLRVRRDSSYPEIDRYVRGWAALEGVAEGGEDEGNY